MNIEVPDEAWYDPIGDGSVLMLDSTKTHVADLTIGGVPFHIEARRVRYDGELQGFEYEGDRDTADFWRITGADGHMETLTIRGSEYIVFAYPYCK